MYEYQLTIGLFDKDTEKQEIGTLEAKNIIKEIIVDNNNLMCTLFECEGCYRMNSTGRVVSEPSIRVEIAYNTNIDDMIDGIAHTLAMYLNQESVMVKKCGLSRFDFIG